MPSPFHSTYWRPSKKSAYRNPYDYFLPTSFQAFFIPSFGYFHLPKSLPDFCLPPSFWGPPANIQFFSYRRSSNISSYRHPFELPPTKVLKISYLSLSDFSAYAFQKIPSTNILPFTYVLSWNSYPQAFPIFFLPTTFPRLLTFLQYFRLPKSFRRPPDVFSKKYLCKHTVCPSFTKFKESQKRHIFYVTIISIRVLTPGKRFDTIRLFT